MNYLRRTPDGHLEWTREWTRECIRPDDHESFADVVVLAIEATDNFGHQYLPVDHGPHRHPRYDIVRAPELGDAVSYSFNGDTYPDGFVTAVSKTYKVVTTSTGKRYYRKPNGAAWVQGGTWSLVFGHHSERNPSF